MCCETAGTKLRENSLRVMQKNIMNEIYEVSDDSRYMLFWIYTE